METKTPAPAGTAPEPLDAQAADAFWQAQMAQQRSLYEARTGLLEGELARLSEQMAALLKSVCGPRSERRGPAEGQLALVFNDLEAALGGAPFVAEDAVDVEGHRRRRSRREAPTSNVREVLASGSLPERVVECGLEDPECPECGAAMREHKVTERRVLELVPARFEVTVYRTHRYHCPACSAANAAGEDVPVPFAKGRAPEMPLAKSFASPSLIAYVVNGKFVNAMPLARIERELSQVTEGLFISRQDMAAWVAGSWERWLSKAAARLRASVLSEPVAHMDETPVQVVEPDGSPGPKKGYMWVMCSPKGSERPAVLYAFRPGRSKADLLAAIGGDPPPAIMSDCYRPYFSLEGVTSLACLVHVRREFLRVVDGCGRGPLTAAGSVAQAGADRLTRIMAADNAWDGLAPDGRLAKRRAVLAPMLEEFFEWAAAERPRAMDGMLLARALDNALAHRAHIENVLKDGRYPLDNNLAERAIRPFVVGRKNWLFCRTHRGAEASAGACSIVESAKANGLNPRLYVQWLLEEMPNAPELDDGALERLMPWSPDARERCALKNRPA